MKYKYRKLDASCKIEFERIAKIHLAIPALWIENYSFEKEEIQDTVNDLINKHKSEDVFCYIIEDKDNIISFIWAEINKLYPEILDIISLWTDEKYRKKGLAVYLKNILEDLAKKQDKIKKITTMVSTKNNAMLKLNEKLGYRISSYNMVKDIS